MRKVNRRRGAATKGRRRTNGANEFRIAGIGASAGGITALQSLFQAIPAQSKLAFVVIQHLRPMQPSALASLIATWAAMPVHAAADGVTPEAGCIYIPSPDDVLTLEKGVFRTRPVQGGQRHPGIDTIDAFLESLADELGSRAIAVVLSGTGSDGAAGQSASSRRAAWFWCRIR